MADNNLVMYSSSSVAVLMILALGIFALLLVLEPTLFPWNTSVTTGSTSGSTSGSNSGSSSTTGTATANSSSSYTLQQLLTKKCPVPVGGMSSPVNDGNSASWSNWVLSACTAAGTCNKINKSEFDPVSLSILDNTNTITHCGAWGNANIVYSNTPSSGNYNYWNVKTTTTSGSNSSGSGSNSNGSSGSGSNSNGSSGSGSNSSGSGSNSNGSSGSGSNSSGSGSNSNGSGSSSIPPVVKSCQGAEADQYTLVGATVTQPTTIQKCNGMKSANNQYMLVMQKDGNLVIYKIGNSHALWATGTYGSYAEFNNDNNLYVKDANNNIVWTSASSNRTASMLTLGDDGVLTISHNGAPTWTSKSGLIPLASNTPTSFRIINTYYTSRYLAISNIPGEQASSSGGDNLWAKYDKNCNSFFNKNGLVLGVENAGGGNDVKVIGKQDQCGSDKVYNQQFDILSVGNDFMILLRNNQGFAVDCNNESGKPHVWTTDSNNINQRWTIDPDAFSYTPVTGDTIALCSTKQPGAGGKKTFLRKLNDNRVCANIGHPWDDISQWIVTVNPDGYCTLRNKNNNGLLTLRTDGSDSNTIYSDGSSLDDFRNLWKIETSGNEVYIKNKGANYLNLTSGDKITSEGKNGNGEWRVMVL